jgi:hypothetical protein
LEGEFRIDARIRQRAIAASRPGTGDLLDVRPGDRLLVAGLTAPKMILTSRGQLAFGIATASVIDHALRRRTALPRT